MIGRRIAGAGARAAGIGVGWWKATHNVHHLVVNSADHDPDIQHMPFLAISPHFFTSLFSRYHMDTLHFTPAARRLVALQHRLFWPLLAVARYGLVLQVRGAIRQQAHCRRRAAAHCRRQAVRCGRAPPWAAAQGIKTVGWEWHKRHTGFAAPGAAWARAAEAAAYVVYFAYMRALLAMLPSWGEAAALVGAVEGS